MEKRTKHFYHELKRKKKYGVPGKAVLLSAIVLNISVAGMQSAVHAMEFGGFDVSTGTGEFGDDWSDWDEGDAVLPEENNDYGESGEISSDTGNISGEQSSVETDNAQRWNEEATYRDNSMSTNANDHIQNDYAQQNPYSEQMVRQSGEMSAAGEQLRSEMTTASPEEEAMETVTATPTEAPTETPQPTQRPTAVPTPTCTETQESREETVVDFGKAYQLPSAECLQKMQLFYWKKKVSGGTDIEIRVNTKAAAAVVSVRINGRESEWNTDDGKIRATGMKKNEVNKVELAVMIPVDLTWTEAQKNVILSYNIF